MVYTLAETSLVYDPVSSRSTLLPFSGFLKLPPNRGAEAVYTLDETSSVYAPESSRPTLLFFLRSTESGSRDGIHTRRKKIGI